MKFYQLQNQLAKSGRRKTTSKASILLVKIKTLYTHFQYAAALDYLNFLEILDRV